MKKRATPKGKFLEHRSKIRVRFHEVDSLRIVWHGHYYVYFEDGRTAFGSQYGLGYEDILKAGLVAPLVYSSCNYLAPAKYNDELIVVARLFQRETATIEFYYEIWRGDTLCATGMTTQVFVDLNEKLVLTMPEVMGDFYEKWQHEMESTDGVNVVDG